MRRRSPEGKALTSSSPWHARCLFDECKWTLKVLRKSDGFISGSVSASGEIEFTTNSPKPPEGPCPGGKNVHFSGQVFTDREYTFLPMCGVTTVTCPQFGEHESYMIVAKK